MSFYLKPPRGVITLSKLEACVQQRLVFYAEVDDKNCEIEHFDCLIEDTGFDRVGHFILRLHAYSSTNFCFKFLKCEGKILLARLNSYDKANTKRFLRRLLKHSREVLEGDFCDKIKDFCLFFESLALDILNKHFLDHIFGRNHLEHRMCTQIFLSGKLE